MLDGEKNFRRQREEFCRIVKRDFDDGDLPAIEVLLVAKVFVRSDEYIVAPVDQSHETPILHAAPSSFGHCGHPVAGQSRSQLPWNVLVKNDALHGRAAKTPSRLGALPSGNPPRTPRVIHPGKHSPAGFARERASPQTRASLPEPPGPNERGCDRGQSWISLSTPYDLRQTGSPSPGHWRLTPALLPPATSNPPLAPLTRSASRKRDSGSHFPTFPPFTRYCGSAAPACFFHSSKVSMSICHDCGDIFFGMVMVAVSPSWPMSISD